MEVKDILLEIISLMPTDIVIPSFHDLCEDNHFEIEERIDEDVVRFIQIVDLWDHNLSDSDVASTCLGIKYTIFFLTLIWHGDLDGYISTQSVLCLISKVMDLLGKIRDDRVISILKAATLNLASIASCFVASGTLNAIEDGLFWDLAIKSKYTDLSIASAFAHRILMTPSRKFDSLSLAEAWDHLRNVLLVILSGCFTEDEGALAILVCPGICMALTKLVQINSYSTEFIMSSPWTMSLEAEINSLIFADCTTERYFLALQQELRGPGKVLSNQLANKQLQFSENNEIVIHGWCPVYCYTTTGSRIVLVPPESVMRYPSIENRL